LLRGIRHLLYGEGYTIRGVQRILKDEGVRFVQVVWKTGAPQPAEGAADEEPEEGDIEPGRGLLGLWPSLLGGSDHSDDDEEEPTNARAEEGVATLARDTASQSGDVEAAALLRPQAEPATRELARDDLRKLKATLNELSECRRLIEAALRDEIDVTSFGQS
jgi:hypothetical protein